MSHYNPASSFGPGAARRCNDQPRGDEPDVACTSLNARP